LEKIEMKKTLVAVAAMAAVTGAMADVTISGFVDKAVNMTTNTNGASKNSNRSVGPNAIGQDQITFAASEDLGSGLKAYVNMSFAPNIANAGTGATPVSVAQDVGQVGIKGEFGNLRIGSDYSTTWYTNNMADASGWGAGAGQVHNVATANQPSTNVVIYSIPSIGNFNATIASRAAGSNTGAGNAFAYLLNYTAGGFSGQYAGVTVTNPGAHVIGDGLGGQTGTNLPFTLPLIGTTWEVATGTARGSSTALTYDFGMAKVYAGYATVKNSGSTRQSANSYTYGISAPLGSTPASIGIAMSGATYNGTTAGIVNGLKETGYRILGKYALSKRTALYVQNGKGTQTTPGSFSTSTTGLGITHSF